MGLVRDTALRHSAVAHVLRSVFLRLRDWQRSLVHAGVPTDSRGTRSSVKDAGIAGRPGAFSPLPALWGHHRARGPSVTGGLLKQHVTAEGSARRSSAVQRPESNLGNRLRRRTGRCSNGQHDQPSEKCTLNEYGAHSLDTCQQPEAPCARRDRGRHPAGPLRGVYPGDVNTSARSRVQEPSQLETTPTSSPGGG